MCDCKCACDNCRKSREEKKKSILRTLDKATEIWRKWPKWKQDALGVFRNDSGV